MDISDNSLTLNDAFEAYRRDVIVFSNQSRKTEENHLIVQRNLVAFFGDIDVTLVTFPMVRDWKLELSKTRSPETVRNYVIKLRVVLGYLKKRGYDVLDPETIPVPKRTDKVPSFISSEDVAKLIQASNRIRSKAIISLLYSTGLRISEMISLNSSDIHDDSITIIGKGGKARLVFVDERTKELLAQYLATRSDNHQALFLSNMNPVRMSATNVQLVLKTACKYSGLSCKVTPHTLRHSFATNLLKNNANIRYVQVLLGHSSLETTQMYTHVVNEDLRRVYAHTHTT